MALFSFLKDRRDARSPSNTRVAGAQPLGSVSVEEVRARARRRLIGAAVLVLAAVVALPLVFESKPRTVAVDTPIEVARHGGLPVVSVPSPKPAVLVAPANPDTPLVAASQPDTTSRPRLPPGPQSMITEAPADAGREVPAPAARASSAQASAQVADPKPDPMKPITPSEVTRRAEVADAPKSKPTPKSSELATKPAPAKRAVDADEGQRAKALLEGTGESPKAVKLAKPAKTTPEASASAVGGAKFAVQVGAFAQDTSAQAAIGKVAQLGLKAHAQDIETPNGKRIRVRLGPFATREEADRAAQRLRAGGQTAAVVTQ